MKKIQKITTKVARVQFLLLVFWADGIWASVSGVRVQSAMPELLDDVAKEWFPLCGVVFLMSCR